MVNWRLFRSTFWLWAVVLLSSCSEKRPAPPAEVHLGGQTWTVELALTEEKRYTGLSGRTDIPAGAGMLFVYPTERPLSFCMRDCPVPIDIAFLNRERRVVNLYEMEVEKDRAGRTMYDSHLPAQYVLEVAGGSLRKAGVRVGDVAEFFHVPPAGQAEP